MNQKKEAEKQAKWEAEQQKKESMKLSERTKQLESQSQPKQETPQKQEVPKDDRQRLQASTDIQNTLKDLLNNSPGKPLVPQNVVGEGSSAEKEVEKPVSKLLSQSNEVKVESTPIKESKEPAQSPVEESKTPSKEVQQSLSKPIPAEKPIPSPTKSISPKKSPVKMSKGKFSPCNLIIIDKMLHLIISDGFQVSLEPRNKALKLYMEELSNMKAMSDLEAYFTIDDIVTVISFVILNKKGENRFRFMYATYTRIKTHMLAKEIDVEEILEYICSYFTILFTSPDALEVQVTEHKETMSLSSAPSMPQAQPGMDQQTQMMLMLQQMMESRGQKSQVEVQFTNIQNEFYTATVDEGIINRDPKFMQKVAEE